MQSAASSVLKRGVELDKAQKYTEALVCYQEGLQILINYVKQKSGEDAKYLRKKIEEYMDRAEVIKHKVEVLKEEGKYHEQIQIRNDASGFGYERIFERFLDAEIKYILIEDPYVRAFHQCQNLVRFLELAVRKCANLKHVRLITTKEKEDQDKWLNEIRESVGMHGVSLIIVFSDTLHDRKITLSNGWIVKIGRGLDYFKPPPSKFSIGAFDMNLRKCHETTVDVFHSKMVKEM